MTCPKCKKDSKGQPVIIDSRPVRNGAVVRRRRKRHDCGHRWTTHEMEMTAREVTGVMKLLERKRTALVTSGSIEI